MTLKRWNILMLLALCMAALLAACPAVATTADEPVVWVAGVRMNPGDIINEQGERVNEFVEGTAYLHSACDLSLHGFDVTVDAVNQGAGQGYAAIYSSGPLTIQLLEENSITQQSSDYADSSSSYGLHVEGDLNLTGAGSLTATGGSGSSLTGSYGAYVSGDISLENGSTLIGKSGNAANKSYGIFAGGGITTENNSSRTQYLKGVGGAASDSVGIFVGDSVNLSDSGNMIATSSDGTGLYSGPVTIEAGASLTAEGGNYGIDTDNSKITVSGTLTVSGGTTGIASTIASSFVEIKAGGTFVGQSESKVMQVNPTATNARFWYGENKESALRRSYPCRIVVRKQIRSDRP